MTIRARLDGPRPSDSVRNMGAGSIGSGLAGPARGQDEE